MTNKSNEFYSSMLVSKYEIEQIPDFNRHIKVRLATQLIDFIISKGQVKEVFHPYTDTSTYKMQVTILSPSEYDDIQKELYRLRAVEQEYIKKMNETLGGF